VVSNKYLLPCKFLQVLLYSFRQGGEEVFQKKLNIYIYIYNIYIYLFICLKGTVLYRHHKNIGRLVSCA
jgi:glycerol-3-phosphate acyltransferase PlsY